ncbi:hypothetical protein FRB98_004374 [Tulasnella sp. 332]|nr:hypothetical protein FRB98_004374 [Tulasnella sp. 332]
MSTPVYWHIAGRVRDWQDSKNAKKYGARVIPMIRGKRFGDLDLIARWATGIQQGYLGAIVDELLDEVGVDTARLSLLGSNRILTRDHDVAKFVLSTGFQFFEKGKLGALHNRSFFGKGIFASDGDRAKMHRALARPYFARERISDYESFTKYTEKLITILRRATPSNEAVDIQDMFARFTMDTAGEFLFGTPDLNTLDLPLPKAEKAILGPKGIATDGIYGGFVLAFEQAQLNLLKRIGQPIPLWTAREFFKDPQTETARTIEAFLEPLAKRALENKAQMAAEETNTKEEESFLDHLARSTDGLMKDQLLNMMLAARDTTAGLLSFACYLLAMHPDVMSRLRQEIISIIGLTDLSTYDNLKNLKYLRAVLNETLRLFPPDLWGDDAEDFVPDRWLGGRAKEIAADPFQFIPFNAGPRICLGQQFAYNEASFVIVRLLQVVDGFSLAQAEAAPTGSLPPDAWKLQEGRPAIEKIHPQSAVTVYSKVHQ